MNTLQEKVGVLENDNRYLQKIVMTAEKAFYLEVETLQKDNEDFDDQVMETFQEIADLLYKFFSVLFFAATL